jgi:serine/threonine-protein phosphatase 2A regulatory subunit B''
MDLIQPEYPNKIMLSDLKKCRSAPLLFDMIFDLRKYDSHVRRIDPIFREHDDVYMEADGKKIRLE